MIDSHWQARRSAFRTLHAQGCFLLPNPWDRASAIRLQRMGFEALASSSAAAAWALGKQDGELTLDEAIAHLDDLCAATTLPVNADFENGFADAPDGVAANVTRALATGIAGLSIEDRPQGTSKLYLFDDAVARVTAARSAIDHAGADVMLVARTESYLVGNTDFEATMARLSAFATAGADVLYAPGMRDPEAIAECVRRLAPKPVNVLQLDPGMHIDALAALGVRRVSTGGNLAHAAWAAFDAAAKALRP
ncbi:MAG: isocitrate lyase/phosphoenolpyruvate mutase family protein [Sphingomonadaceae bacterium]